MGSGIAGRRRLPRQGAPAGPGIQDNTTLDEAATPVGERAGSHAPSGHSTDLIRPLPLSYEERRDRWLRDNGTLWRDEPEGAERQRI